MNSVLKGEGMGSCEKKETESQMIRREGKKLTGAGQKLLGKGLGRKKSMG